MAMLAQLHGLTSPFGRTTLYLWQVASSVPSYTAHPGMGDMASRCAYGSSSRHSALWEVFS